MSWPWKIQANRKILHIEVDKGETKFIEKLIEVAKEKKYFEEIWGKQLHVIKVMGKDTSAVEIKLLINVSQKHTNFNSSMTAEELVGIIDFDAIETVYSVPDPTKSVATMSLHHALYKYVKIDGRHSLIAEAHQRSHMGSVDIVIPNTPEAETMVAMMKKQLPAYLTLYIDNLGMDKDFIRKILTRACCPALMHEVYSCPWDKETKVLTTPGENEKRKNSADIESAAWYRDKVGEHMVDNKKKSKIQYAAPEALYDLDGDQSVKRIHERNDHCYVGSSGAATLDLSKKARKK